jgi:hypothetical protein
MRDRLLRSQLSDNCIVFVESNLIATAQGEKRMNFATSLQLDSISLPVWADTTIRNTCQAAAYSHIIFKAFNKTLAPLVIDSLKEISLYLIQRERLWYQWTMRTTGISHNPLQAAFDAAYAELMSPASIATYRRIRDIVREAAIDAVVIGLCGVVAVSVGIDIAQAGYRAAAKLFGAVYGRLNPSEPQPGLAPSVSLALASTEFAAALDKVADVAEANVQAKVELVTDFWSEPVPLIHTLPVVVGAMWNPPPRNMHQEVARLLQLQHVPLTPPAPIIEQPAPEPVVEQKLESRAQTKPRPEVVDELARELNVPGAIAKPKRERQPTKARANASASNGEAEAEANAPRGGRTAKG